MSTLCPILKMTRRMAGSTIPCREAVVLEEGYNLRIYDRIEGIRAVWEQIVPSNDPYWSVDFLQNIERQPPGEYQYRYLVFYRKDRPVGVAYAQITQFSAWQSIRGDVRTDRRSPMSLFRNWLAKWLELNVLILGNTLVSGQYAYHFTHEEDMNPEQLRRATDQLVRSLEKDGIPVHMVAVKDLERKQMQQWNGEDPSWKQVCFQPRMVVDIRDRWSSIDDYIAEMHSKYRVRFRRARKKLDSVISRRLTTGELEQFQDDMYGLYWSVASQSGFNMVELDPSYWLQLKQLFGDSFSVRAYFKNGVLVGFYSMLRGDHAIWHANYLGYDDQANQDHQLYLNMLYDMVEAAIEGRADSLDLSRTALEIKSSVGAEPEDLYCYFRHRSALVNPFIPWITQVISPDEPWTQRHPFRAIS